MKNLALITGGTSGIGFGTAKRLAASCDLALAYATNHEKAEVAAKELRGTGARVELFAVPLSNPKDAETLLKSVEEKFGKSPEILVNSAGRIRDGIFMQTELSQHHEMINEHLLMTMALCHGTVKSMYRNKFGRIVNLSSISASFYKRGQSSYAAAKAGIEAFSKSLAMEVAHRGVTVNCVAPGLIATPMTEKILGHIADIGDSELKKRIPVGRVGTPEEVGSLIAYLCSPDAAYVTGTTLTIDGGRSLGSE